MKKTLALIISLLLLSALAACGTTASSPAASSSASASSTAAGAIADGVYTAQVDAATAETAHGWTDTIVVTYKDGAIVEVIFESYDADGNKKSETTAEDYPMDPLPSDWMPDLASQAKGSATPADIDGVTGATTSSNNIRLLLAAILAEGKVGETITVTIPAEEEDASSSVAA